MDSPRWVLRSIGQWDLVGYQADGTIIHCGEVIMRPWGEVDAYVGGSRIGRHYSVGEAKTAVEGLSPEYQKLLASNKKSTTHF